jgi:hypothetical protein
VNGRSATDNHGQPWASSVQLSTPVTVYLARLTSGESRRAMATSLELLAELLMDGQPAERAKRAHRRHADTPLAIAVPWDELTGQIGHKH